MENESESQFSDIDHAFARAKATRRRRILYVVPGVVIALLGVLVFFWIAAHKVVVGLGNLKSEVVLTALSGDVIPFPLQYFYVSSETASIRVSAMGYEDKILSLTPLDASKTLLVSLDYAPVDAWLTPNVELTNPVWVMDGVIVSRSFIANLNLKPGNYHFKLVSKYRDAHEFVLEVEPGKPLKKSIEVVLGQKIPYTITSIPSGARVKLNGDDVGHTPVSGEIAPGDAEVELVKDGYQQLNARISVRASDTVFNMEYKLQVQYHSVDVTYSPAVGRVFVDGKEVPKSRKLATKAKGRTKIKYSADGYRSKTVEVDATTRRVSLKLEPIYTELTLNANVPARVSIDGKHVGVTPMKQRIIARKRHLEFTASGYVPHAKELDLSPAASQTYSVDLQTWKEYNWSNSKPSYNHPDGLIFIRYRAQSVQVGAPRSQRGQRANELIRHVKFSRAFYLSQHEVTEGQFAQFNKNYGRSSTKPATNISWNAAALYCNWLSQRENIASFYIVRGQQVTGFDATSLGYRLPTEAEWEYVAGKANKRKESVFVWGDKYDATSGAGNIADETAKGKVELYISGYNDGHSGSAPVGSQNREPSGMFDMSGNVTEWVHDVYSLTTPTPDKIYVDYMGLPQGQSHVVKGSNFMSASWTELRVAFKESLNEGRSDVGFRVAKYVH